MKNIISSMALLTVEERRALLFLLGIMFIGMLLEMLGIGLVIPIIGLLIQQDLVAKYPLFNELLIFFGNPTQRELIVGTLLMLVSVFLTKNLFLAFMFWMQTKFVSRLQANMSQRLFTIYLRQPYTFHLQRNSAELIRNVGGEVSMFAGSIIAPSISLVTEGIVLIGICALLMMVEPFGTFIVVSVLGVASWGFYRVIKKYISKWGESRQFHDCLRTQHLYQGLNGAKEVKLSGRESDFVEKFSIHTDKSARVNLLQSTFQQLPRLWLELLAVIGLASLIFIMLAKGNEVSTILPTLGLFAAAAFRLMPSVNRILGSVQTIRYAIPVVNTLRHELLLDAPEPDIQTINNGIKFNESIRLSNVNYTYPGSSVSSLENITLCIQKGTSVGIIGPSGSGKSTLLDIMLGLLSPDSGEIKVDEKNIHMNLRAWQDQIGYVSQSIYLTDDTLRRNVAFGLANDEISDIAVQRAISDAQLEELVAELPNGLETIVGENGIRLSGGQRQRIGIARALYHDPSVLFLDEATSALDVETELGVMQAIKALGSSKTIIIVAHRLSTVEHCNVLYRLENGKVAETGSPKTILKVS